MLPLPCSNPNRNTARSEVPRFQPTPQLKPSNAAAPLYPALPTPNSEEAYFLRRNAADLEEHGDVVRARIRQKDARKDGLWVQFEYLDEQGTLQKGTEILRGSTASVVQISGYLEIRYDRRRPDIYDIATNGSQSFDRSERIAVLVGGILFGTIVLVLISF